MQPNELKTLREALNLTQGELGDAIGMSRKSISQMELGNAPIEKRTAMAVSLLTHGGFQGPHLTIGMWHAEIEELRRAAARIAPGKRLAVSPMQVSDDPKDHGKFKIFFTAQLVGADEEIPAGWTDYGPAEK